MSSFVSKIQKWHLFCRNTLRNSKNRVSKGDGITLTWFWGVTALSKINILNCNLARLLLARSFITNIPIFWKSGKISIFWVLIYEKIKILFLGVKHKKIRKGHFVEQAIRHILVFVGCVLFWNPTFQKPLNFSRFFLYPKSRDMTSLKRHFLKKYVDFSETAFEDAELMLNIVYKFRIDICSRF